MYKVENKRNEEAKRKSVPPIDYSSSVNCRISLMLRIITNKPIVVTTIRPNPNHPRTIAELPTPLLTLPLPMSWAMVLAATDAVCCHSTETSTKTDATKIRASAA
ncbi:unnamed protein product [Aspergillus oryzae]|uniref:Unnamed protein product n=2 Tax=Aspergillus oryzae TaxID=5062 RepID=A0AAN4YN38_ASPOZ|nr:unnamed protein product [Aspergillus oryzae]GMF94725.1 unnamed protein product [Aspergillus oryzae]GMG06861.1 unnamed protein product [Aspergillus oryzae]GMG32614.1 unnamed protein product [Aspergillus oryzae]GMG50020.1 unnamed protein product [Aspergillus oryzae var. brunneus]